jgi:phage-related minor tail protein
MFMIIRRDTLLELQDHNETLQEANAHWRRQAEEAEANAAETVRSRMSCLNRQLSETGERNVALATELGQVQTELDKARAELTALRKDSKQAAAPPPDGLAGHITVAVNTEDSFGRPPGWDRMDYETRLEVIDREAAARKETAAGKLSALLQVMQDTGLTGAGFGAALGSDLRAVESLGAPVDRITRHRLQVARDRVYASGLDLLALPPDAVLVVDKTTMAILGDPPDVVELSIFNSDEWDIR